MKNKIYAIFSGSYSDWKVHGYFLDKDKAEKYCAIKNQKLDSFDSYYVVELNPINSNIPNVKLKYFYKMCIRFQDNPNKYTIDEPFREYYLGKDKERISRYNIFKNGSGWFSYSFNCESDEKALKIIKDKYMEVLEKYNECKNYELSCEALGSKHI